MKIKFIKANKLIYCRFSSKRINKWYEIRKKYIHKSGINSMDYRWKEQLKKWNIFVIKNRGYVFTIYRRIHESFNDNN